MTRSYTYYNITRVVLALLMMVSTVCAWADNVAQIGTTEYATLKAAVEAATDGQTVTLIANTTETETYSIDGKHITIYFGEHTVTASHDNASANVFSITSTGGLTLTGTTGGFTDNTVKGIFYNQGTLTVEGGNYTTTVDDYGVVFNEGGTCIVNGGTLTGAYSAIFTKGTNSVTVNNGTINGAYLGIQANAGTTLSVTGGAITATNEAKKLPGIQLKGTGTNATISDGSVSGFNGITVLENAQLNVSGTASITGTNIAITGNGSVGYGGTTITINGGTITNNHDVAIYHPQNGSLTINGGTITGTTALEVRAGTVNITGGTLKATATEYTCNPNGNGTTTVGAALAIAQHTTKLDITVTISGGTFTGVMAISESNPQENDPAPQVTMSVTEGTFTGGITTADVQHFIKGGTFSAQPEAEYCSNNFVVEDLGGGHYGVLYDLQITDATTLASLSSWNTKTVKATYARNTGMIGAGSTTGTRYGTICLPFTITAAPTDIKLYKATSISESLLTITEIVTIDAAHAIAAGTPLIFELTDAATAMTLKSIKATVNTTALATEPAAGNLLVGTYTATTLTTGLESIYYLNGDKFHQASTKVSVPAYRAYLKHTASAGTKPFVLNIAEESDNLTGIHPTANLETTTEVYDLNNHKLPGLQRGINILRRQDGSTMKVIVK